MSNYSIDLQKLKPIEQDPEELGLGDPTVEMKGFTFSDDSLAEYDDDLKLSLQRAEGLSFGEDDKTTEQNKFDKVEFLQGISERSSKSTEARNKAIPTRATTDLGEPLGGGLDDLFYSGIKLAEGRHGKTKEGLYTPVPTKDKKEKDYKIKSKDIGYGHKVKNSETAAKEIYGIPFIDEAGDFIPLTEEQVETIYKEDMKVNLELARESGWDRKLKDIGTTWEALPMQYKLPLMSLAYNVGGKKAGQEWTAVLLAAKDKNIVDFAKELRRKDAGKNTKGMDNRVIRELKAARLISDSSEVKSVLGLTDI
tara:strand:- start:9912 stop:10838 length:927 start_codon:yes stop_codon:yes gene_type:complete